MLTVVRSALFAVAFYGATALIAIVGAPGFLLLPQRRAMSLVRLWGRVGIFLLRVVAGVRTEIRGRENIPCGKALVASKHQSMFETFALLPLLRFPSAVLKRELAQIPVFGLWTVKTGMIPVDRDKGASALRKLSTRAQAELAKGRQIIVFPEGTRRSPGAPPDYQSGIALLYKTLDVPVVPVALNSGLFWPRRSFRRYPGTIVVEFLPPIPPGLSSKTFLEALQTAIETAADRLLVEAARADPSLQLAAAARARLAELGAK